jgi:hypothetical protein
MGKALADPAAVVIRVRFGLLALLFAVAPVSAAEDVGLTRMATCQDSWLDWQMKDPAQLKKFGDHLHAEFSEHGNDPFVVPKANVSIAGLRITQLFPNSVGMGVGLSATVDAPFDKARQVIEKASGKSLAKCETSDGMRSCELEIGEKRTLVLMAEDNAKATTTLVGCYYFYEK